MFEALRRFVREEEGQTLTEYGLLLALIAVAVIGVLVVLGGKLNDVFSAVKDKLDTTGAGSSGSSS